MEQSLLVQLLVALEVVLDFDIIRVVQGFHELIMYDFDVELFAASFCHFYGFCYVLEQVIALIWAGIVFLCHI